jgi:iron(III) transport system substrate-binding protein
MNTMQRKILFAMLLFFTTLGARVASAADLVVYSSAPASLAKALAAGYTQQSGQHVDLYVATTGKIMARLAAEASQPHADVVILADWTAGLALADQGMALPYRPEPVVKTLRPEVNAPGPFLPVGADVVGIVVNTRLVGNKQVPHDWSDLTMDRWKGMLTMPDPTLSGTASDFLIAYMAHEKQKGWDWLNQLKANGCIWPGPNASALRPVEMGERSIMVAGVGHTTLEAKIAGNTLDLIIPRSGALLIPRPIIVMKSSHQLASAERFVDFAMSPAGQADVAKSLLLPAVKSVQPAPVWPQGDALHVLPVDWTALAQQRAAVLARFNHQILGR